MLRVSPCPKKKPDEQWEKSIPKNQEYDNGDRLIDHVQSSKERDILALVHNNEKIDASLCMLKDTEEYTLEDNKYNTLPSQYIINLLNGEQHEKKE